MSNDLYAAFLLLNKAHSLIQRALSGRLKARAQADLDRITQTLRKLETDLEIGKALIHLKQHTPDKRRQPPAGRADRQRKTQRPPPH